MKSNVIFVNFEAATGLGCDQIDPDKYRYHVTEWGELQQTLPHWLLDQLSGKPNQIEEIIS